jgi:hypothetical protein
LTHVHLVRFPLLKAASNLDFLVALLITAKIG